GGGVVDARTTECDGERDPEECYANLMKPLRRKHSRSPQLVFGTQLAWPGGRGFSPAAFRRWVSPSFGFIAFGPVKSANARGNGLRRQLFDDSNWGWSLASRFFSDC